MTIEHSVLQQLLHVRRIRSEDLEVLSQRAREDGYMAIHPTHVGVRDDKIVGYLSVGAVPMVLMWASTKDIKPRDVVSVFPFVEDVLCHLGATSVCFPCEKTSPFFSLVEKFGFVRGDEVVLFHKELR